VKRVGSGPQTDATAGAGWGDTARSYQEQRRVSVVRPDRHSWIRERILGRLLILFFTDPYTVARPLAF
jgi:hypothetical protein